MSGGPSGTSQPFAIYNGGTNYYVNDSSTVGDTLTTAVGNNANSGKAPNAPLADIQAVLSEYNPGAGAVIHVDAGTYHDGAQPHADRGQRRAEYCRPDDRNGPAQPEQ